MVETYNDDSYELLPRRELLKIKNELENIKQNPLASIGDAKTLMDSMDKLSNTITELLNIFKTATEELKVEEKETDLIKNTLEPIKQKMAKLEEQNQIIAQSLVNLSDSIDELRKSISNINNTNQSFNQLNQLNNSNSFQEPVHNMNIPQTPQPPQPDLPPSPNIPENKEKKKKFLF